MAVGITGALGAYQAAVARLKDAPGNSAGAGAQPGDFLGMVKTAAQEAMATHHKAERMTTLSATGQADLNAVVMAVSEAELTLNTVVSVRDKVLEAYREIIRMPI